MTKNNTGNPYDLTANLGARKKAQSSFAKPNPNKVNPYDLNQIAQVQTTPNSSIEISKPKIALENLEWIQFNKPWKVFENTGRCKPGVLVEIKNEYETRVYLIGHINSDNTAPGDMSYFDRNDWVIKYCVLIDLDRQ